MHNYILSLKFPTKRANCFPKISQKMFRRKFHIFFSHFVRSQKNAKILQKKFLGKQNAKILRKKYGRESFFAQLIFQLQNIRFSQKNRFGIFFAFFIFAKKCEISRTSLWNAKWKFSHFFAFLAKVFVRVNFKHCVLFVLYDVIKQS